MKAAAYQESNVVRLKRLGIDTYQEPEIFMAAASPVCRAEGWTAQARVQVSYDGKSIVATLHVTTGDLLAADEASLSETAWMLLGAREGDPVRLSHPIPVDSLAHVRAKVYGQVLAPAEIDAIVRDIVAGRYSSIELAAFVTACAGGRMSTAETIALTKAMVAAGERLYWGHAPIIDKHCVGGLPGNRTSMLVVPIVAACGLVIPKTSSRAITSPAGTADAMETIAPVDIDLPTMRRAVEREGACIVAGTRMRLSPADDIIIGVERPLDFDSENQLVASVLSKKIAAGATHVLIDVPVGPTAKVRSARAADAIEQLLGAVGRALEIDVRAVRSDGTQPVGRGIGPALEARDVLAVLRRAADAPSDLRDRALRLAGEMLEMGGAAKPAEGCRRAADVLDSGAALAKFEAICRAQGGQREPAVAPLAYVVRATRHGRVAGFDNRRLAKVAKLAGAPRAPAAGIELHVRVGATVDRRDALLTIHAETPGELDYARAFLSVNPQCIDLEEP
jgi:thymidine phosphorylase